MTSAFSSLLLRVVAVAGLLAGAVACSDSSLHNASSGTTDPDADGANGLSDSSTVTDAAAETLPADMTLRRMPSLLTSPRK